MKTALVTGSAGFVGRHLCPELAVLGYEAWAVDPNPTRWIDWLPNDPTGRWAGACHAHIGSADDILARGLVFDVVVHLAANIENVDARMRGGVSMYQDTVLDYAMAEYLEKHPPRECAVWMTSCATDNADDPYSWVKLNGEKLAGALCKQGIPVVILRPYSGYGPDQSPEYPFPAILGRAMRHEDPLTVWGSGKQVRDFIHIDDLTDAILWGIEKGPRGIPIPIGTGVGTDFLTLARMMSDAVGYRPEIKPMPQKAQSSPRRVCDPAFAELHGWKAKISLEEGIRRAVEGDGLQVFHGAEVSRRELLPGPTSQ